MIRRTPAWLAVALLTVVLGGAAAAAPPESVDLNRASLPEILDLPIPEDVARSIVEYRTFVRFFSSVYDLMEVEGMTAELLARLKPLVATMPPDPLDASIARLAASYRQVNRFLGQEGASEGLADEYLDMMRDPVNVNDLDIFDLQSFQNVSPVDARNIVSARERLGRFESARQLRRADGLRYWSYRNLRDFVVYSDDEGVDDSRVRGNYQMRYYDSPYFMDDDEIFASDIDPYLYRPLIHSKPHMTQKMTLNLTGGFRAGVLTDRNLGEEHWDETFKGYYGVDDKDFGPFHMKRLYFGNYRLAFGQGLVMDNTDFSLSRKTGFGWNKRPIGVRGDLSRSHQYALQGAAMEGRIGRFHTTVFASWGRKDGILNPDGTVNNYVSMTMRRPDDWYDSHLAILPGDDSSIDSRPTAMRRDAFREDILGGNVRVMLGEATYVGFTAYEARYDRAFSPGKPDSMTLVNQYAVNRGYLEARDSEIFASYNSLETDPETGEVTEHKFRRVYGAEFQTVVDNVSFQGEYGVLQDPTADWFKGKVNDALLLNAYAQWDNLHLLALYRDYDVGYDNPYHRGFANDTRYEQTLLDAPYRLNDDYYSWLAVNTPQSKPERGVFFQSRYRISRNLIINGLEMDRWERKADGADMSRYTLKVEYQPKFNIRLRMRHRYSSRSEANLNDVRWYQNWESRFELITLLSNWNRLRFMYMTSNVWFPPRPRLSGTGEASADDPGVGTAAMPADAFQVVYEHHLTPTIRLLASAEIYNGFLWNFEGNEFRVVDGQGFRNWFKVESRVSDQLLFQLKVTRDHNLPMTGLDIRRYGEEYDENSDGVPGWNSGYVPRDWTTFRLQMDYTF